MATITDRKQSVHIQAVPLVVGDFTRVLSHYQPEVVSISDYYPFGSGLPNRQFSSNEYRYGFQGQEKDDEIKGTGNSVNYKYRMADVRLGRFFSVDPLTASYPHYTPYSFSGNKVIAHVELEGLEEYFAVDGSYIGNIGGSTRIRVLRYDQSSEKAKKTIQSLSNGTGGKAAAISSAFLFKNSHSVNEDDVFAHAGIMNHYFEAAGFELNSLENNSVKVESNPFGRGYVWPSKQKGKLKFVVNPSAFEGDFIVNKNDAINFSIHEFGGHGNDFKKGLSYDRDKDFNDWEERALRNQIKHKSWEGTSSVYKEYMLDVYGQNFLNDSEQKEYFGSYGVTLEDESNK